MLVNVTINRESNGKVNIFVSGLGVVSPIKPLPSTRFRRFKFSLTPSDPDPLLK